ncbi:hypothetical protein C7212DRAFT_321625 [Tuber magnatum]|uniref:Uncharacterized protein n=1 Tax=Tuber magnatum TaxID=42249 RepID=A0A317SS17_9PEZI|nr:hypothetical protein C7212DRAFT_321625 [Tuber magnatum]
MRPYMPEAKTREHTEQHLAISNMEFPGGEKDDDCEEQSGRFDYLFEYGTDEDEYEGEYKGEEGDKEEVEYEGEYMDEEEDKEEVGYRDEDEDEGEGEGEDEDEAEDEDEDEV